MRTWGWKGYHCEGSIFRMLFSLLMWDVIFADVPNVFRNSFQGDCRCTFEPITSQMHHWILPPMLFLYLENH